MKNAAEARTSPTRVGPRRWVVFVVAFAALLAPMVLWALASPLASVPDEASHAIRAAAVVRGEFATPPASYDHALASASVPRYVDQMLQWACFARMPDVTPACDPPVVGNPDTIVRSGGSAGTNNPAFYAIVGLPTLVMDGLPALYGMRIIGAILCAAALAFAFMQLSTLGRSRWATAALVVAVTPMVIYLSGSINPNGIEAASAVGLFVTLVAVISRPLSGAALRFERAIGAIVLLGLLVSAKNLALLWVVFVVIAAIGFLKRSEFGGIIRQKSTWVLLAGSIIVGGLSLAWFIRPPNYGDGNVVPVGARAAFVSMIVRTFDFTTGYVGVFGWLDTPSPTFSYILWASLIVAVIVAGLIWGRGRARLVAVGFGVAMLVVPPVVQAVLAPHAGYLWQGRYMLAVLLCFLVACGMAIDAGLPERPLSRNVRRTVGIGIGLIGVGQIMSFVWVLQRYTVGADGSLSAMVAHPSWQPPLGWIPLSVLLAIVLAVAAVFTYRHIVAEWGVTPESESPQKPAASSARARLSPS